MDEGGCGRGRVGLLAQWLLVLAVFAGASGSAATIDVVDSKNATQKPVERAEPSNDAQLQKKLSLQDCIRIALEENPRINAAHWEAKRALERVREAKGYHLPFFDASGYCGTYDRDQMVHTPHKVPIDPDNFDKDIYGYAVTARLPLFRGGRIVNGVNLARAQSRMADSFRDWTEENVIYGVTATFYRAAALTKVFESTLASLRAMESHEQLVARKVKVGRGARVDWLRVRVRVADLKQQAVKVRSDRDVALHFLSTLMGLEESLSFDALGYDLAFRPRPVDEERFVREALANRPDYEAAQQAIVAQEKRVAIARGEHWPSVGLRGSYTGRGSDDVSMDENWYGGIEVELPIFRGGTIQSRVAQAKMALQKARAEARALELEIRHAVKTACLHIQTAEERIRATQTSIQEARESLRIEREKYANGRATITDVLDAQAALLRAQTNYFQALADHRIAWAELALATGNARAQIDLAKEKRKQEEPKTGASLKGSNESRKEATGRKSSIRERRK